MTGTLIFSGPGPTRPVPGQVIAANSASGRFTVTAGDDGRFRLELPPGTYQLTGHSPEVTLNGAEVTCRAAHPVDVAAHGTTPGIKVACHLV